MLLNRQLKYNEFKGFWECINNKEISPEEFRTKILSKYLSSNEGITEKGFIKFFEDTLLSPNGEVNLIILTTRKQYLCGCKTLVMIASFTL